MNLGIIAIFDETIAYDASSIIVIIVVIVLVIVEGPLQRQGGLPHDDHDRLNLRLDCTGPDEFRYDIIDIGYKTAEYLA